MFNNVALTKFVIAISSGGYIKKTQRVSHKSKKTCIVAARTGINSCTEANLKKKENYLPIFETIH